MLKIFLLLVFTLFSSTPMASAAAKTSSCDLKLIDLPDLRAHVQELIAALTENGQDLEKRSRLQLAANEVVSRTSYSDRGALEAFNFLRELKKADEEIKLPPVHLTEKPLQTGGHEVGGLDLSAFDVRTYKTVTYGIETDESNSKRIGFVTFVMVTPAHLSQVNWDRDFQSRTFEPPATEFKSPSEFHQFKNATAGLKLEINKRRRETMVDNAVEIAASRDRVYFATILSRVQSVRVGLSQGDYLHIGQYNNFLEFLRGEDRLPGKPTPVDEEHSSDADARDAFLSELLDAISRAPEPKGRRP